MALVDTPARPSSRNQERGLGCRFCATSMPLDSCGTGICQPAPEIGNRLFLTALEVTLTRNEIGK